MADGEVRKVDRENKKMTIKHGELKNLDMPRMTMVFPIRNATLLETFKASDKVKFVANKLDGVFSSQTFNWRSNLSRRWPSTHSMMPPASSSQNLGQKPLKNVLSPNGHRLEPRLGTFRSGNFMSWQSIRSRKFPDGPNSSRICEIQTGQSNFPCPLCCSSHRHGLCRRG